jgi:hypothetical protein
MLAFLRGLNFKSNEELGQISHIETGISRLNAYPLAISLPFGTMYFENSPADQPFPTASFADHLFTIVLINVQIVLYSQSAI